MMQHEIALARGNDFRLRRAQLKREIKAGEIKLSELLLEETPEWLEGEPIGRLVRAIPRMGPKRVRRLLAEEHIPELREAGALTKRQRLILRLALRRVGG